MEPVLTVPLGVSAAAAAAAPLTLHLVVEGELLACSDGSGGEQSDPWKPLVNVVDENVKHLKVWVTLEKNKQAWNQTAVTHEELEVLTHHKKVK